MDSGEGRASDVALLTYRQIECSRCGAARIVAAPCPDCGAPADAREADPRHQARARRARRAIAILETTPPVGAYRIADLEDVTRLVTQVGDWLHTFLGALDAAAEPGPAGDLPLDALTQELAELHVGIATATVLRPWTTLWKHVTELVQRMDEVARAYIGALDASLPRDAQRLARRGQEAIDAARECLARVSELEARMARLSGASTVAERLQLEARELYGSTGAESIIELCGSGEATYKEFSRTATEVSPAVGLLLGVIDVEATTFLSRGRFIAAGREVLAALGRRPASADPAFRDSDWLDEYRDATQRLFDASVDYAAMFQAARRDRDAVRSIIALGHTLIEGPGRRYLSLVLSAVGTRPRASLVNEDAFAVVKMAAQAGMPITSEGFPAALRRAKAHESWEFDNGRVRLDVKEPALDPLDLVDRVLGLFESVIALHCAIGVALVEAGVPESAAIPTIDLGFTSEEMLATVLELTDLKTRTVEIDGERLSCECVGTLNRAAISRIGMLTPWLPEPVRHIRIEAHADESVHIMEGPAEPLRKFSTSVDPLEHSADFLVICAEWSLDGEPVLSDDHLRKWTAMQAGEALRLDIRDRTHGLRRLMRLAKDLGLIDMVDALAAAIAISRAIALDAPPAADLSERLAPLIEWEKRRLPGPF